MGLKTICYAPFKSGKTVLGLSMAELGPLGVIDTEGRIQHYTRPHPTVKPAAFPFDNPRVLRTDTPMCERNPKLRAAFEAAHPLYLVQTQELMVAGQVIEKWSGSPDIAGIDVDSGSVLWDLSQDTVDEADDKMKMLAWVPVKRFHRRLQYALQRGNKHALINAHVQEKLKLVEKDGKKEFVSAGNQPWLEKKSPYWADLVVALVLPESSPWPTLVVVGEGFGGAGGLIRGARLVNPTWRDLVERVGSEEAAVASDVSAKEIEHRNKAAMVRLAGMPVVSGVDGPND